MRSFETGFLANYIQDFSHNSQKFKVKIYKDGILKCLFKKKGQNLQPKALASLKLTVFLHWATYTVSGKKSYVKISQFQKQLEKFK